MQLPRSEVLHVRDTCLCLATQRAARLLARRFDAALREVDLTNGQFSLMMALHQPNPPTITGLAHFLGMEPSTLTAAVKPLARRGLLTVEIDPDDRRARRLRLTPAGAAHMRKAVDVWQRTHAALDAELAPDAPSTLRRELGQLTHALGPDERSGSSEAGEPATPLDNTPPAHDTSPTGDLAMSDHAKPSTKRAGAKVPGAKASPDKAASAAAPGASSATVKGPASYFPSIEAKYGRPISDWKAIVRSHPERRHMELVKLLKEEHGMGHGHANAIVAHTLAEDGEAR